MIDCLAKTYMVTFTILSNFASESLIIALFMSILIPKTIIYLFFISFKSFVRIHNKLITQI